MEKVLLKSILRKVWRNIGFNLYHVSIGLRLAPFFSLFILVTVPILGLLLLFLEEPSLTNIANAFESTGPYSQLFFKCCLTRLSINQMHALIREIEDKFWPIDHFGDEVKQKQVKTFKIIEVCFKGYIACIYPCLIVMIAKPLFNSERMYPLPVYNIFDINNNVVYLTYYGIQIFAFFYASGCLLAIDGLFALYVVNVLCQLIMLQHAFESLNIENIPDKKTNIEKLANVKKYVDHHNIILKFIDKIENIYSMQLFFQFIGNTASICMGVFIVSSAGMKDFATSFRAAFIVSVWFCQLSVYCIGGTLLTEACAKVAIAMYGSKWEGKYTPKFRYATQMVIMQSQKQKVMHAGKIFDVNLSSFSGIVRLAVSLYTLMNKVQNKK